MVSEDETPGVRVNLVEQIPECFLQCHEHACPDLEYYLYDRLLQVLLQYLGDDEIEVRREAFTALTTLLEKYLIDKKRIEEQVCPAILNLSKKVLDNQNELQLKAVTLMGRTAIIIGPEKTQEIFLKPFIELCSCKQKCVRRACTVLFPIFAQVMGGKVTEEQLLPVFFKLCEDEFWGVRKACADSIPLIALVCTLKCRRERFTPVVMKLVEDANKWVVCSILKVLGQFIPTFADPCIVGLTYLNNGELRITNPVDPDFRDHPDPEILSNYEHLMNTFVEVSAPTNKSFDKDLHENLTCEQIAQIITENKQKLIDQMNDDLYIRKTVLHWKDDTIRSSSMENEEQNIMDQFFSILSDISPTFTSDKNSNKILNSTFMSENIDDNNKNENFVSNIAKDLPSPQLSSATTTTTAQEFSQSSINNNTSSASNDTSSNSSTSRKVPGPPLHPTDHFRRKNTPADLSSIIKQAIYEGQERNKNIPPPISIPMSMSTKSDLKISLGNTKAELLETPSIENTPKSIDFPSSTQSDSINEVNKKIFVSDLKINPKEIRNIGAGFSNRVNPVIALPDNSSYSQCRAKEQNEISQICINTIDEYKTNISNNVNIKNNYSSDIEDDSDDDVFNEFNSHRYWYISPELPLDIDLVASYESTSNTFDDTYDVKSGDDILNIGKKFDPPTDFSQNIVPVGILESFVKMVLFADDPEMNVNCAYHFPAVALTIGRNNWHIIKSLLVYLCDDLNYKVRKTIASAIDVLAMILGRELATQDLIPIYLGFFKDLDEVKIEAIKNFANFLNVIDPERHEEILSSIGICLRVDSKTNWRIKEDMAKQVVILIQMYESLEKHDCLLYLTSLTGLLLEDKVSCVREIAADAMASIIRISSKKQQEAIVRHFLVQEFSLSDSWRKRQTFVNVFYTLSKTNQLNEDLLKLIIHEIARLSMDTVPNIRIIIARFLVQLARTRPNMWDSDNSEDIEIVKIVRRLQDDEDRDVRGILDEN